MLDRVHDENLDADNLVDKDEEMGSNDVQNDAYHQLLQVSDPT